MKALRPRLALALGVAAALTLACRRDKEPAQLPGTPPPPRAWTQAFMKEAILVADEIHLEGPEDLLEHVVIRQDPEAIEYSTRTVESGLFQELRARPEMGVEIRAQLDAWSLAAVRRMTVLQRPGEVPVTVRGQGNAVWVAADGSERRDEASVVFQGLRGR
jgi:hypothetical protein